MANSEILKNHLCGFNLSLQKGSDEVAGFGSLYETLISSIINGGAVNIDMKTFPVIFHVLTNGGVSITESGSVDFDPSYILTHVNSWCDGSSIKFVPAEIAPDGTTLTVPGLNIIDGASVVETRTIKGAMGTFNNTYRDDLVAVTGSYSSALEITGVTLDHLYSTYRWAHEEGERYLNVFVVNSLKTGTYSNGKDSTVYMSAENPYIAEQLDKVNSFNCAIEFSGLGRAFKDESTSVVHAKGGVDDVETNFGYMYLEGRAPNLYTSYKYKTGDPNTKGFRDRGRSLLHCLGHMLGLVHPKTQLGEATDGCPSTTSVYTDGLTSGVIYGDITGYTGVEPVEKGESGVAYSTLTNTNTCDSTGDVSILANANNHMVLSQRDGPAGVELGGPSTEFDNNYKLRIHANCEVEFYDPNINGFRPGILKSILMNTHSVIPNYFQSLAAPCELAEAKSARRPGVSKSAEIAFKDIESEIPFFNKLVSSIKKLKAYK
tara:strand:+ start:316 stop:1782 length:1467 start_codon:yes stop_codon:yes gene_type:complete